MLHPPNAHPIGRQAGANKWVFDAPAWPDDGGYVFGGDPHPGTGRGVLNVWDTDTLETNATENNGIWAVYFANPAAHYAGSFSGADIAAAVTISNNKNFTGNVQGVAGSVVHGGSGTIDEASGVTGLVRNNLTGTITQAAAFRVYPFANGGGGAITNAYGLFVPAGVLAGTNKYGVWSEYPSIFMDDCVLASDADFVFGSAGNYSLKYDSANARFEMFNLTGSVFRIPDGQVSLDANTTWDDNVYDDYDDAMVLFRAFGAPNRPTVLQAGRQVLKANTHELVAMGVLRRYPDGFIGYNDQRMAALLAGGIYQTRARLDALAARVAALEAPCP